MFCSRLKLRRNEWKGGRAPHIGTIKVELADFFGGSTYILFFFLEAFNAKPVIASGKYGKGFLTILNLTQL
jgi:hypothetical protein